MFEGRKANGGKFKDYIGKEIASIETEIANLENAIAGCGKAEIKKKREMELEYSAATGRLACGNEILAAANAKATDENGMIDAKLMHNDLLEILQRMERAGYAIYKILRRCGGREIAKKFEHNKDMANQTARRQVIYKAIDELQRIVNQG